MSSCYSSLYVAATQQSVTILPFSSSSPTPPQRLSITPAIESPNIEYRENILVVSQPTSSVTIVSDTHTTFSSVPVTTLSVVECLTTSSSVVTSISGPHVSTITTTAGTSDVYYSYVCTYVEVVSSSMWV